jgi:hypothetical protein
VVACRTRKMYVYCARSPHEFKVCAMRAEKVAAGAQIEIGRHRALSERVS